MKFDSLDYEIELASAAIWITKMAWRSMGLKVLMKLQYQRLYFSDKETWGLCRDLKERRKELKKMDLIVMRATKKWPDCANRILFGYILGG